MLRTVWVAIVALFISIVCATTTLVIAMVDSTSRLIDPVIRFWARTLLWAAGIRLTVEGREKFDPKKGYVVIANHASYFDIPVLFVALPQAVRFFAKKSLFQIPIFGWALTRCGFIPVDRKNRRKAVESFDLGADRIRKGNTIVIFPEEGRSRTREMKPFQRGAYLLALRSDLPILPVGIVGNYDVMNATSMKITPGPVKVVFSDPIATEHLTVKAKHDLSTATREIIQNILDTGRAPSTSGNSEE